MPIKPTGRITFFMQTISQKTSVKKPEIKVEATAKGMTVNAGLVPVLRFMDALLFDKMISGMVSTPERAANAEYSFSDVVQMTVCAQIAGATALEHVSKICGDEIISHCAGWEKVPHATSLGRIIKSVRERNITELESLVPKLRDKVWKRMVRNGRKLACAMTDMIIDMDSTVQGVCGRQEGAQKGYNPHKKGQLAYHPLLAFCAETKEILHSWYRCGSAYTSNGAVEFMKELMAGLRKGVKYLLRADSGFFDGDLLDYLESIEAGYLIKVKLKNLDKVLAQQTWTSSPQHRGWEETTFSHQCGKWSKARTFVGVRHQTGVADDLYKTPIYDSFCYVTTEKKSPMETHRHYGKRATSETWIEECKSQMGAGYIRTGEFLANSALFQCGILAYNILKWMGLLAGGTVQRWEVKTIRLWLIRLAGKLVSSGRQLTLKVPCKFLYREQWDAWEQMTHNLCFE
jgi:2C-methyl-D-erythritol 2,4-cyclodiphosphate synthase